MTHCGFGGTTEFIMSGVPVVTFPHFGDQPALSNLLTDAGAGEKIADYSSEATMSTTAGIMLATFPDPLFNGNDVFNQFKKIITDPKYMNNVCKLKVAARAAGGREKAVSIIEDTFIHFMAAKPKKVTEGLIANVPLHLIDEDLQERSFSCCLCCWSILIVVALTLYVLLAGFPGILNLVNQQ